MSGTLYLVASPIGNLGDITYRAVETLKTVDFIASEDTRTTKKLLDHYQIRTKLTSYYEYTSPKKRQQLIDDLSGGKNIALISDAGTPLINDPGYRLVEAAVHEGIPVTGLPGPSSVLNGLILSGLPTDRFIFLGFLPQKDGKRKKVLEAYSGREETLICLESPYRLLKALQNISDVLDERKLAVCREMTKKFEEIFRGTAQEALEHFKQKTVKGEITLILQGALKS